MTGIMISQIFVGIEYGRTPRTSTMKGQGRRNKLSVIPPLINQLVIYYRRMKSILSYIASGSYITHLFPLEPSISIRRRGRNKTVYRVQLFGYKNRPVER